MTTAARNQSSLFGEFDTLKDYQPRPAPLFEPQRIVLTKACDSTLQKRQLVDRICNVYPQAEVEEQLPTPRNKVVLDRSDLLDLHYYGRRTLVNFATRSILGCSRRFAAIDPS